MRKDFTNSLSNFLGLDIGYLIKNVPFALSGNLLKMLISLGISIILTRTLDTITFGNFNFILSILGIITIFSLPGLNSSLLLYSTKGFDGSLNYAFKKKFKYAFFAWIAILIIILYNSKDVSVLSSIILLAIVFPLFSALQIWAPFLHAKIQFKKANQFVVTQSIVLLVVLLIAAQTQNLLIIVFSYFLVYLITDYLFLRASKKFVSNKKVDPKFFSYGKFLTKLNSVGLVTQYLDSFLLGVFAGPVMLAYYSIARVFFNQPKDFFKSAISVTSPKMVEKNTLKLKFYIYLLIGLLVIITIAYFLIEPIILLLYGSKYAESIPAAKAILFSLPLLAISLMLKNHLLLYTQDKKVQVVDAIVPPALRLLLLFPLYKLFGIVGLALSFSFHYGLSIIIILVMILRKPNSPVLKQTSKNL